eukprot:GFUD01014218.1.p1 GENE.GFUD01014218.1~~GFUD01014218.1.p1  ORF type:complete len:222 (-),score=73.11 GFUD01014218.1:129-794(-)
MAPIDVYGMPLSAPCRIVNMTAECLGMEYNFKMLDLMAGEHMKPEFLAINPMHNIPTMVDGDFVLNESRAIAAYLVNKYGKDDKLYPKDAELRARVDQRLYFDMGVFYKAFGDCVYPVMFGGDLPGQDKFDKLKEVLGWVEGFVKDDKFCAGNDDMTIGDLALLATYSTLKFAELSWLDLAEFKNIEAWYEKCCKLVPNYEKANGEGATAFGGFYKSKASA